MGDGGGFHFHCLYVDKMAAHFSYGFITVHKLIAAHNQPTVHGGVFEYGGGFFRSGAQGGVGFEARGHTRHMANGIAEGGNVHIVMCGLCADHYIAHF